MPRNEPRPRVDPRFAEYVTRVAFNLSLSKDQITALAKIKLEYEADLKRDKKKQYFLAKNPFGDALRFSNFGPAYRGLERRGLATWEDPAEMKPKWDHYPYKLTEAGELVFKMLELAGMVKLDARIIEALRKAA